MKYVCHDETGEFSRGSFEIIKKRIQNDNWFSPQEIKNMRLILGGITQKEFAERVGVTVHAVENWEQGRKRPDRRSLIALEKLRSTL